MTEQVVGIVSEIGMTMAVEKRQGIMIVEVEIVTGNMIGIGSGSGSAETRVNLTAMIQGADEDHAHVQESAVETMIVIGMCELFVRSDLVFLFSFVCLCNGCFHFA